MQFNLKNKMAFEHLSEKNIEELDTEIETENTKKIEAALFLSGRFMTIQELVSLTDVNPIILKKILSDLQDKYKEAGMTIIQKDNMFKMDVAEQYSWMVNKLATGSSEFSKAEQETLAMIAYKQPIKQSVIIKIRGNKAYDHIKKFVEIGLINKKKAGHTADLTLAEQFYEYFHANAEGNEIPNGSQEIPVEKEKENIEESKEKIEQANEIKQENTKDNNKIENQDEITDGEK